MKWLRDWTLFETTLLFVGVALAAMDLLIGQLSVLIWVFSPMGKIDEEMSVFPITGLIVVIGIVAIAAALRLNADTRFGPYSLLTSSKTTTDLLLFLTLLVAALGSYYITALAINEGLVNTIARSPQFVLRALAFVAIALPNVFALLAAAVVIIWYRRALSWNKIEGAFRR